jgi:site-specific DNA-methyltransferase (adenine-specific)
MSNPKLFKYEWIWEKSKASNFLNANKQPLKAHENIVVFSKNTPVYFPQKTEGIPFNKGKRKLKDGKAAEVYRVIKNGDQTIANETGLRNPRSVQYFITAEKEGKYHPTQKPISLCEYLIKTYTTEGQTVLDNCAGSGTTGIACLNTNRKYIMIEKEEQYYNTIGERILQWRKQNNIN